MSLEKINLISYLLLFLTGAMVGVMDKLQFHYLSSIFSKFKNQKFYNPKLSWENKWKWHYEVKGGHPVPVKKERFWGSSTIFVWTTDAWHSYKFIMLKFLFLSVLFHNEFTWWDIPGVCMYYAGFWVTFESNLLKK